MGSDPSPLSGRHVFLRPVSQIDYEFLFQLAMSEELGHRGRFRGETPSPEDFVRSVWHNALAQFIICAKDSGDATGHVYAYNANTRDGFAYVGISLAPWAVDRGWALEAGGLFINYLFTNWDFRKLYGETVGFSFDSTRSGLGAFFVEEGALKEHYYYDGRYWDVHILALHRSHWEAAVAGFARRTESETGGPGSPGPSAGGGTPSSLVSSYSDFCEYVQAALPGYGTIDSAVDNELVSDIGLDSIGILELVLMVEDLGVCFTDEDFVELTNLRQMYEAFDRLRTESPRDRVANAEPA